MLLRLLLTGLLLITTARAQQTVRTPRGCGLTVNGPCCQANSSAPGPPFCRGAGLLCVWDTILPAPLNDFGRCKRWISSECGGIGQPCCSNFRGGLENRNAANPDTAVGTYNFESPCSNGLETDTQWRDSRGKTYCERHSKRGAELYRDSMSGVCTINPPGCGRHGQQCCMTFELQLPTLYTCTCEEDFFVGTARSWSTDYTPYDVRVGPRRCGSPRPVFKERAMTLDISAMLGPSGLPMFNGDWDTRPQEMRSPDNCTRVCSSTPGCQYSLFIRFGTRSRCFLRRVESAPAAPGDTSPAPTMYSLPSAATGLGTTIRTSVMPSAIVPVFGGPDAKPYQCRGSARSEFVNFQGGDIAAPGTTQDPSTSNNSTAAYQPAANADACCLLCEAQTQPQCERWTFAIPYAPGGSTEPGRCYLKSNAVGQSIAVPTAYSMAAAPEDAAKQLVYTSGVLTGAQVPRMWQGLLRNHSRNDCKPTGPIGERKGGQVQASTTDWGSKDLTGY